MTGSNETNKMEIYNDWGSNNSENENLDHARKQLTFNRKAMLIAGKPPKHPGTVCAFKLYIFVLLHT